MAPSILLVSAVSIIVRQAISPRQIKAPTLGQGIAKEACGRSAAFCQQRRNREKLKILRPVYSVGRLNWLSGLSLKEPSIKNEREN
jgi:hypothetical protein